MSVYLPKGTRDLFGPSLAHRYAVIDTVRAVFTRFGFEPLETPAFERIETLMGKYGDEGEQLIYKILERGAGAAEGKADLALRYDLTVPLARFVAMNPGLRLPFKRYQVQPVWRADRPQKGRFREFWQCDVDIVGCTRMTADAEALAVVNAALTELGFSSFTIRLNHRALLRAVVDAAGVLDLEGPVLVALDKLDKIGREGVTAELRERGLPLEAVGRLWGLVEGDLDHLASELGPAGAGPVADLREVLAIAADLGVPEGVVRFDPTLARGLSYYTGPVFETLVEEPKIGSISGGGRYDGLVGMFSGKDVPAVGVSLGLERIITVMEELGMAGGATTTTQVLVTVFSDEQRGTSMRAAAAFRAAGVPTEVWLDAPGKVGKQFKAANKQGIPWVVTIGPDEAVQGQVQLKDLRSGEQVTVPLAEAVARIS